MRVCDRLWPGVPGSPVYWPVVAALLTVTSGSGTATLVRAWEPLTPSLRYPANLLLTLS